LDKWVPVAWHVGGYFYTSEGAARGGYYGVSGIPQLWADGIIQHLGAYTNNEQMYQWYIGTFNSRRTVSSPLAVTILKNSYGNGKASVKVKIDLDDNVASGHLCHIVLWETNLNYGGRNYAFVERALATKNVTVTNKGQSEEFSHEFTLQGSWKVADLGVSVLVQNNSTKLMANGYGTKLVAGMAVAPTSLGRVKALYR
jgi:hypothetical protein